MTPEVATSLKTLIDLLSRADARTQEIHTTINTLVQLEEFAEEFKALQNALETEQSRTFTLTKKLFEVQDNLHTAREHIQVLESRLTQVDMDEAYKRYHHESPEYSRTWIEFIPEIQRGNWRGMVQNMKDGEHIHAAVRHKLITGASALDSLEWIKARM